MKTEKIYIGLDFDGTCVTHDYPLIGREIGAVPILKELVAKGHKIVLNTMRSGQGLLDAKVWFEKNDIPVFGWNYNPTQSRWTKSPKVYAHLYIDDAALGVPLIYPENGDRPYVDWVKVKELLIKMSVL